LLLLFSTLVTLLAGELFLRLFFPVNPPRLIVESGPADWILWNEEGEAVGLNPGFRSRLVSSEFDISIQLNEHGFRDQTFVVKRLSSATRICVLGDSHTFGFGVDASEILANALRRFCSHEAMMLKCTISAFQERPQRFNTGLSKAFCA
jgi:hypothetical protein